MSKPFSRSKACAAKGLFAAMEALKANGGSLHSRELYPEVEKRVKFSDWELERAGKMQYIRWHNNFQFYSIDYVVAGYIVKKNGQWFLTPEGEEAMKNGAEYVMQTANDIYHKWDAARKQTAEDITPEDAETTNVSKEILVNLEELEDRGHTGIQDFIRTKGPYEYQDMVAALLRAMGYYTPFIAPKGKDGGIDIVAYVDPLGAQTPRIKVQVKHKPDTPIPAADVRALLGVLKAGDIALFVTSGTFSSDARSTALNSKEYVRIIDGDEFIDMWQQYYDKMTDEDKNMLPLKRISFLGINE